MGKKKKKTFTNDEVDEVSTDEEKESLDLAQHCPHVGKAVNVGSLKKALKAAWIRIGACGPCAKDKRQQKPTNFEGLEVWMCLKCGIQACGTSESLKDAKGHAQVQKFIVIFFRQNDEVNFVYILNFTTLFHEFFVKMI